MIRHTPAGRGHAYRPSLDQRVPAIPQAGQVVELRALVPERVPVVTLELSVDGDLTRHPTTSVSAGVESGAAGSGGHLAAAAAAGEHVPGMRASTVTVGPFGPGVDVAYRWVSGEDTTPWYRFTPATWQPAPEALVLAGADELGDRLDDDVAWLVDATGAVRLRFALRLDPDEHVLGLGERFHALDHRGHAIDTVVFEQYKQQGERTYLPVPFALVVGGVAAWGVHVDTTRRCWFNVAATTADRLVVEVALDPARPHVAVDLFAGEPYEVIRQFLDATARPAPVPTWTFRPWASANEWNTQARVEEEVARSRDADVPLGVLVLEAWSDEATFTAFRDAEYVPREDAGPMKLSDFSYPADGAWPDPVGMVERLHAAGIKVLLWQIPVLPTDVPSDRRGAEQLAHDRRVMVDSGYAVGHDDGTPYTNRGWWFPGALLPDFTSPQATAWWTSKRRYLVDELGIDGFKTDGGEHPWGDELRYADGTRGDVSNNRFPNLYARAYHDLLAACGRDGVTFSRAGFTGAGATPGHWAGDEDSTWEAFRASILAGLSAGISGVFAWGFDHGGFSGELPTPELYLRSAAMAMLCPIMQYHAEYNHHRRPKNDRTPWNIAERHGAPEVLDTYRSFAHLRERLVGYLDEQYHAGIATGRPLMRALALEWPTDQTVWRYPLQYLLGDELLVAPVTEQGAETWAVYLPSGTWLDAWTGDPHEGAQVIEVDVPLDRMPAFARGAGAGRLVATFRGEP